MRSAADYVVALTQRDFRDFQRLAFDWLEAFGGDDFGCECLCDWIIEVVFKENACGKWNVFSLQLSVNVSPGPVTGDDKNRRSEERRVGKECC